MACKTLREVVTTIQPKKVAFFPWTGHDEEILEEMYIYFNERWRYSLCSTSLVLDYLMYRINKYTESVKILKKNGLDEDVVKLKNGEELSEEAEELFNDYRLETSYEDSIFEWDSEIANATVDELKAMDLPEDVMNELINIIENEINEHFTWDW